VCPSFHPSYNTLLSPHHIQKTPLYTISYHIIHIIHSCASVASFCCRSATKEPNHCPSYS
jgi:hypothetical protein